MRHEADMRFIYGLMIGIVLAQLGLALVPIGAEQPQITDEMYESYATLDLHRTWHDGTDIYITPDIKPITELAEQYNTPSAAEEFVMSIPYVNDTTNHGRIEYWAFPAETLYLNGGDCEDRAFLFVSIVRAQGNQARCIDFMGHMYAQARSNNSAEWVDYLA